MASRQTEKNETAAAMKSSNVKVVVRVRPPNEKELQCGKTNVIKVIDDYMLAFDPKDDELNSMMSKSRTSVLDKRIRDLNFAFDRVFSETSSNQQVFEHTTQDVLDSILDGYNCSVFAYGATSAGKTHTMLGSQKEPGVIFLTMMELYKKLMEKDNSMETDISVSYLEIYNETCKDLLLPTGPLAVREDPEKGVCVNGLSLHKPRSAEELLEMLHFGNQNRTQHPTDANKQSSRSHAVFQVFVRQCPKTAGLSASVKIAKMSLIDLAGSERATVTTNRGDRLREGANINKSLLALGNCINALAENKENLHVPYRNSKLTRLLKDSLGGNCKTIMIAAVSPSTLSYVDTYNTLKYANRTKSIKSTLSVNTINVDYHVTQYVKIVEDLKSQIEKLQLKLDNHKNGHDESQHKAGKHEEEMKLFKSFEYSLTAVYKEKSLFKQDLIQCEANERKIKMKLEIKEKSIKILETLEPIGLINLDSNYARYEHYRKTEEQKLSKLKEQKIRLQSSLEENKNRMINLQNEIDKWVNNADQSMRMQINLLYESKQVAITNLYLQKQSKYWEKCFKLKTDETEKKESLLAKLIEVLIAQHRKLNCYSDGNSSDLQQYDQELEEKFEEFNDLVKCGPKISWADQSCLDVTIDSKSNVTSLMTDFTACTPFKTPSKRPSILRQLVLESRQSMKETTSKSFNESRISSTDRNTVLNTGPVRSKLVFTDKENVRCDENDDITAVNNTTIVLSNIDDGETMLNPEHFPTKPKKYEGEPTKYTCADLNSTFSVIKPNAFLISDTHEMEFDMPITPLSETHEPIKSYIPIKTPLKLFNERIPVAKNSTVHRVRVRSFTEGSKTFIMDEHENANMTSNNPFNQTFNIKKAQCTHKTSHINRKMNLGAPSRAYSSMHKENIRPTSSHMQSLKRTHADLKIAHGFTSLIKKQSSGQSKDRFRF